ncbi:MAG: hypothetical protein R3Y60_04930 [bacterium]
MVNENVKTSNEKAMVDMLFYKPNTVSYYFILLSVLLELFYLIFMLSKMEYNYLIGIFIIVNICFLLLLFTMALENKVYKKQSSILAIVFGVYVATRFYTVPFILNVTQEFVLFIVVTIAISWLNLVAGFISIQKIKLRKKYIEDGSISSIQMSK